MRNLTFSIFVVIDEIIIDAFGIVGEYFVHSVNAILRDADIIHLNTGERKIN